MSALPSKADIDAGLLHDGFGPEAVIAPNHQGGRVGYLEMLLRITSVDFVGLEIASSRLKKWRADAHLYREFC